MTHESVPYENWAWATYEGTCASPYIVPAVLKHLPASRGDIRILDFGCGNGFLAGRLLGHGYTVVGIDLSSNGVEVARNTHPTGRFEVVAENVLETLNEDPFDVVVSTEVIEHLYSPKRFLEECFACLRPGGQLILTTPDHSRLKNTLVAATGHFDQHFNPNFEGGHIKFWSRATLGAALARSGFSDIQFDGLGRVPLLRKSLLADARRP